MNGAYKLPDCYKKDVNSNNYKLLEISSSGVSELMVDIRAVQDSKDIRKAYGATLDRFGAMIGQPRGQLNDTQYRYLLYMRIGLYICYKCHSSDVWHYKYRGRDCH